MLVAVELWLADELDGLVLALEVELVGVELLDEVAMPDEVFAEALVPFAFTAM